MKDKFKATFNGGAESSSHETATFFMIMDERRKTPEEIQDRISIGRMCDPFKDWDEIQRVLDSMRRGARSSGK